MNLQALHRQGLLLPSNPKAVVDQLLCGLCLDLLLKPVSCKSGHTFCLQCISRATQDRLACPGGCNDSFPIQPPYRNLVAQGCVDSLECRCPNAPAPVVTVEEEPLPENANAEGDCPSSSGNHGSDSDSDSCLDTGSSDVVAAAEQCTWKTVQAEPSPADTEGNDLSSSSSGAVVAAGQCTWTGPFGQLRDHLERCGLQPCGIQGCAFEGKGGVLAAHRLACPKRPVPCPHCQAATALDGLGGHLAVCEEVRVACPYACMGCHTSLTRKSMPAHIAADGVQHLALADAYLQTQALPSASFELTIKNVQQKIAGKASVISPKVPFPLAGFPQGQVFLRVRFGGSDNGVQRDGKTLSVYAFFTCPGAPAVEPPPEICFQGTIITLVSQDGAVKNVEWCMTSLDAKARLGRGRGWPGFCQDVTPFVKDDTIVVKTTIRVGPADPTLAPSATALKHTVA